LSDRAMRTGPMCAGRPALQGQPSRLAVQPARVLVQFGRSSFGQRWDWVLDLVLLVAPAGIHRPGIVGPSGGPSRNPVQALIRRPVALFLVAVVWPVATIITRRRFPLKLVRIRPRSRSSAKRSETVFSHWTPRISARSRFRGQGSHRRAYPQRRS
jgi:hypothetical protein